MDLFISLGMEMGSWLEQGKRKYFIMLQENEIELTPDQYDLWILAQQAAFTPARAAEYLKKDEALIRQQLALLIEIQVVMYWNEALSASKLAQYTLTPRGHAVGQTEDGLQLLKSYIHAKPVDVDSFGHALWMMTNNLITLDKVVLVIANKLGLSTSEAYKNCSYWIPFLIRHGLVVLNPSYRHRYK